MADWLQAEAAKSGPRCRFCGLAYDPAIDDKDWNASQSAHQSCIEDHEYYEAVGD